MTGLVPTGWYRTSVAVRPRTHELVTVAAKGLGSGYTRNGGYAPAPGGVPQAVTPTYYDGDNMPGLMTVVARPSRSTLVAGRTTVLRNTDFAHAAPTTAAGPIPTDLAKAGQSPITHVVYIVRENRTYDQVYGDLAKARNDVDADPAFESLSSSTPQGHKRTGHFANSDRFFSDGGASVQGHYWTTSANVDDYVEKSWRQYYSNRNHTSDSVGTTISAPQNCSIFQAAQAKATDPTSPFFQPGFTYQDDGDPVGLFNPSLAPGPVPGLLLTGSETAAAEQTACGAIPAASADLTNFGNFLGLDDRDSANRFLAVSGLTASGTAVPGSNKALKNFTYLELPNDHTTDFTPQGPTNLLGHTPPGADRRERRRGRHRDLGPIEVVVLVEHDPVRGRGRQPGRSRPRRRAPQCAARRDAVRPTGQRERLLRRVRRVRRAHPQRPGWGAADHRADAGPAGPVELGQERRAPVRPVPAEVLGGPAQRGRPRALPAGSRAQFRGREGR